jgi:hypothetical protein
MTRIKMTKTIRSTAQLADILSTDPTIESVSRSIYKNTDCGAWVDERPVGKTRKMRFKVIFGNSIYGPVAHQWQAAGRGTWRHFGEALTPRELAMYIGGPEPKMVGPILLDDGTAIRFVVEETDVGEYGVFVVLGRQS